jgi:hypothetical protein
MPQDCTACATREGSAGSSGGGVWLVLTLQKLQPRVHVSPISMMVAVAVPSLPPQHSPMLGHFASSHTVARLRLFTLFDSRSKFSLRSPVGVSMRSHSGLAGAGTEAKEAVGASAVEVEPEAKAGKAGPSSSCARRRSRRAVAAEEGAEAAVAAAAAVASARKGSARDNVISGISRGTGMELWEEVWRRGGRRFSGRWESRIRASEPIPSATEGEMPSGPQATVQRINGRCATFARLCGFATSWPTAYSAAYCLEGRAYERRGREQNATFKALTDSYYS